ncbi:MAG: hypothetical protein K6B68_13495 [Eubacterium sp.]|nr:hypothetical protein [Eubacterium sp.]
MGFEHTVILEAGKIKKLIEEAVVKQSGKTAKEVTPESKRLKPVADLQSPQIHH